MSVKTRFAPSPTGLVHFGNIRTALFNALFARKNQGTFLLRIEDTDLERSQDQYTQALKEDLVWLGLDWQEGPAFSETQHGIYHQSERTAIYEQYLNQLIEKGYVYPCFCTPVELEISRKVQAASGKPPRYSGKCTHLKAEEAAAKKAQGLPYTLRFRMPKNHMIVFHDLVRGTQKFNSDEIGDFIIRRSDGSFAFFFVNAVDDALMHVSHVLRGEDHLTNTPRQIAILEALGLPIPTYGHISLIVDQKGAPLSKRNGSLSIQELRALGFFPIAINNYLARLGHHYADNRLLELETLSQLFETAHLGRAPACYDRTQLDYWQGLALQQASTEMLVEWLSKYVDASHWQRVPEADRLAFVQAIRANITQPQDSHIWIEAVYDALPTVSEEGLQIVQQTAASFFDHAIEILQAQNVVDYKAFTQNLKQATQTSGKNLFMPLRVALTGQTHGPEMSLLLTLIGQEKALTRLAHIRQSAKR